MRLSAIRASTCFRTFLPLLWLGFIMLGCAHMPKSTTSVHLGEMGPLGACADFFASLDDAAKRSGARDAGAFRVEGYPYLRVNRLLTSFNAEVADDEKFEAWLDRLQGLDRLGRFHELENLPAEQHALLLQQANGSDLYERIIRCGDLLRSNDFRTTKDRDRLRRTAKAPHEYTLLGRAAGLYPLPSLFVSEGVKKWHERARQSFSNTPPDHLQLNRYVPTPPNVSSVFLDQIIRETKHDSLGIPLFSRKSEDALFDLYAPIWEAETNADYDRIGAPEWTADQSLQVNTNRPDTFKLLSYTRFDGRILPQLNYIIWFPSRPKESAIDLVGGLMDGVNYRVTLDSDGRPLMFETVHNCGCYHKYFPTLRIRQRFAPECTEAPLVLQAPVLDPTSERLVISMESGTHYVQHLYTVPRHSQSAEELYNLRDYNDLRSLPSPEGGRRSMFGEDGIVPGTERLERFIFWPTGVPDAGAMRQWGRHAVAFIGRRHFDDPYLIQELFARVDSTEADRLSSESTSARNRCKGFAPNQSFSSFDLALALAFSCSKPGLL